MREFFHLVVSRYIASQIKTSEFCKFYENDHSQKISSQITFSIEILDKLVMWIKKHHIPWATELECLPGIPYYSWTLWDLGTKAHACLPGRQWRWDDTLWPMNPWVKLALWKLMDHWAALIHLGVVFWWLPLGFWWDIFEAFRLLYRCIIFFVIHCPGMDSCVLWCVWGLNIFDQIKIMTNCKQINKKGEKARDLDMVSIYWCN